MNLLALEELVDEVIEFFTAKAINEELYRDILSKCSNNPMTLADKGYHQAMMNEGALSLFDFMYYKYFSASIPQNTEINVIGIEAILNEMANKNLLLREPLSVFEKVQYYSCNEERMRLLHPSGIVKNILLGFKYILRNYSKSVFKILVETDEGDSGIGTGFVISVVRSGVRKGIVMTNAHVAKYTKGLQILTKDDEEIEYNAIIIDEPRDLAAIILTKPLDRPFFRTEPIPEILDEVLIMGYPPVPTSNHSYLLAHMGEINSFIKDIWGNDYILFSAKTSPGNSGGPVLNGKGLVVGMVVQQLIGDYADLKSGRLPYFAAIPSLQMEPFLKEKVFPNVT